MYSKGFTEYFRFLFLLHLIITSSSACGPKYAKMNPEESILDADLYISPPKKLSNADVYNLNPETIQEVELRANKLRCNSLLPWMRHLALGRTAEEYTGMQETPTYSPFLDLTCALKKTQSFPDGNKTLVSHIIPDIVEDPVRTLHTGILQEYDGFEDIWSCLNKLQRKYLPFLEDFLSYFLQYANNQKGAGKHHAIHIFSYKKECYKVKLKGLGARHTTDEFQKSYFALPVDMKDNRHFNLFEKFGDGFSESLTFGGRLTMVVAFTKMISKAETIPKLSPEELQSTTIKSLFNTIDQKFESLTKRKRIYSVGGEFDLDDTLGNWAKSVCLDPVPVSGKLLPFPIFMSDPTRAQGFKEAMTFQETRNRLETQLLHLQNIDTPYVMTKRDLIEIAAKEISSLRPTIEVVTAINKTLLTNPNLSNNSIVRECYQFEDKPGTRVTMVLLDGVCSNLRTDMKPCLVGDGTGHWTGFRPDNCIKMYKMKNCNGVVTIAREESIVKNNYRNIKSFMLC